MSNGRGFVIANVFVSRRAPARDLRTIGTLLSRGLKLKINLDRRRLLLSGAAGIFTIPFTNLLTAESLSPKSYDYIVVGAGSAGCIIAARLAQAWPDAEILLIEAGSTVPKTEAMVWDPSLYMLSLINPLPQYEWGYLSEPQTALAHREISLLRGKGVGGCALRNGMVYVRGGEAGFNQWALNGAPGWEYARLTKHFEAVEQTMGITKAPSDPLIEDLVRGAVAAGLPFNADYNASPNPYGIGPLRYTIRDGRRETTHTEFMEQQHYPNLSLATEHTVHRIAVEGQGATGVYCGPQGGEALFIGARQEVIVSAGAIGSPHLLLLSGLGAADQLRASGVAVKLDLPGVGQNLQDDVIINQLYMSAEALPPMPNGFIGLVAFARSLLHRGDETDIQMHFGGGFDEERKFLMISPMILLAESRGQVSLRSTDPFALPRIDPRYLTVESDWKRLIEAIQLAKRIAAHEGLQRWCKEELVPGRAVTDDAGIRAFIREQASTGLHYAGTCKMGLDPMAVVDPQLKVHGCDNLRVADASIIPRTVSGNTAGATMMIAHRAAAFILGEKDA